MDDLRHLIKDGIPLDNDEELRAEQRADSEHLTRALIDEATQLLLDLHDALARDGRVPVDVLIDMARMVEGHAEKLARLIRLSREMWP
jgi:hypothetical protein